MQILHLEASARRETSHSRLVSRRLVDRLQRANSAGVVRRDLSSGLPYVDEQMIGAYYTAPADRTDAQRAAIALSEQLVEELEMADVIVAAVPMYNFAIPASFKAWIDLVARVGRTFRYTENGPEGLLAGKTMYIALATGGTPLGSEADFASPYLRHILKFIGITDVHFVAADEYMPDAEAKLALAYGKVDALEFATA